MTNCILQQRQGWIYTSEKGAQPDLSSLVMWDMPSHRVKSIPMHVKHVNASCRNLEDTLKNYTL